MKLIKTWAVVIPVLFASAACSVITSEPYSTASGSGKGIPYFLPVGKIHLQVIATDVQVPAPPAPGSTPPPVAGPAPATPTAAAGELNKVNLSGSGAAPRLVKAYTVKYVETVYVPDPRLQYVMNYKALSTSDDDVKVTIGSNGLLSKIAVTTKDETGAIILKFADLATQVAKMATIFAEGPTVVYETTFDPFDPNAAALAKKELGHFNCAYSVRRVSGMSGDVSKSAIPTEASVKSESGVAFRPVFAYDLALSNGGTTASVQTILMPNEAEVMTLPITRAAFVTKVSTITFDHGLLTEVDINKPSEMLAFMDIPIGIAKAIVDIPAQLVKLRIDTSKSNTDLMTQQKSELQMQQQLDQLREQIQNSKASENKSAADAAKGQVNH